MAELNPVNPTAPRGIKSSLLKQPKPVGHLAKSSTWSGDKSQGAAFENHNDAVTHKRKCAATKNSNVEANEMNCANAIVAPTKASGNHPSQEPEDSVGRLAHCTSGLVIYARRQHLRIISMPWHTRRNVPLPIKFKKNHHQIGKER
jgi:hypothetical protein